MISAFIPFCTSFSFKEIGSCDLFICLIYNKIYAKDKQTFHKMSLSVSKS